jgi:thiol-disulfide isomerase/thioredoxin
MDANQKSRDRFTLFLGAACTVLAALTLLLAYQNLTLKARLAAALGAPPAGALKTGDVLAAFDVVDTGGRRSRIDFDGERETLLLVFSSTCGACRETLPVWNRALADAPSSKIHVVGIQTDFQHASAGTALSIPDLQFPVFGSADPQAAVLSKFPAIPAAALINGKGAVTAVWFGVPTEAQMAELRRALAS